MFEMICDSCGEIIGQCSVDLSSASVYCANCTPDVEEDDEAAADEKPTDEDS